MVQRSPFAIALLGAFSAATGVHLWAQWSSHDSWAGATQWVLMPLLVGALLLDTRAPRSRLVRGSLVALFFSWLGDSTPRLVPEGSAFLVLMGCFLIVQIAYIVAFLPYAGRSALRVRRILLAPYIVGVAVLVVLCLDGAGAMLFPVLVYGLVLGTMAVLATGVNGYVWAGGALFLVSDALIALGEFSEVTVSHNAFWVMLTYVLAQALIVLGVEEHAASAAAT